MRASRRLKYAFLPVAALAFAAAAPADEGLWTYERVPREAIAARRGVTLDDAWLSRAQLAAVRLNGGCSATFVSPRGLMITSRQCVESCLAENSTASSNLTSDGFSSRSTAEEKRCRRLSAQVLVSTEDVTGQVMLVTSGLEAAAAAAARAKELARLEQACEQAIAADPKAEPLDCEPVALFDGGEYRLYKYRNYGDLRLSFAAERSLARFAGGDLEFPRLAFDVAFLRAYVDGTPAETPKFLSVNFAGPAEHETLFVSGHPAVTARTTTLAELQTVRDTSLLGELLEATELKGRYGQFSLASTSAREHIALPLERLERELGIARATFAALLAEPLLAAKRTEEDALKQRIAEDPELKLTAAAAFGEIASAQQAVRALVDRRMLIEGVAKRCQLCRFASLLVRAGAERQKPDAERRPEFRSNALPRIERELASTEPVTADVESLNLSFALERLRERLGPADPLAARLFASEPPAALAERAINRTRLVDPAFRSQLWSQGAGAVVASDDPLIVIMRELEAAADTVDASWRPMVDAPLRRAHERLARARIKFADAASYPDATGTLRLSVGTMSGWSASGQPIAPLTTLAQMYDRAASGSVARLPARWLEAKDRVNGAAGLDLVLDNDVGAGCVGCGVLSATGELVGVVFDANRASAAARYWFDAPSGRAIAFDCAALKEILLKVYRADELMKEMVIAR
jgi:hypothetical protein